MTMDTPLRRRALITAGSAIVAMAALSPAGTDTAGPLAAPHANTPMTTGSPNSFTPTSTNDLMTPVTAPPGSPWRD